MQQGSGVATAKQMIDGAIDLSDAGQYQDAYVLLTRAIETDPSIPQGYFERAIVLMNMDRDQESLSDLDRCLELDPQFPGARDWRARANQAVGKSRQAAEDRLKSLREHPMGHYAGMGVSPQDWADCAEAFAEAGDIETAVRLLEEYLEEHSKHVSAYARFETAPLRMLARFLILTGRSNRAVELARTVYTNARYRCPMDIVVYGLALEAIGQSSEALKVVNEALRENDQMEEAIELKRRLSDNTRGNHHE